MTDASQYSKARSYLTRPWIRRAMLLMLALIVIQYEVAATILLRQRSGQNMDRRLLVVWAVGAVAVFLLTRAWRSVKTRPERTDGA